jgi:CopG family transcriptional regulator/antitoxin EndoAI
MMSRTSKTITFSLPPEMAAQVEEIMKEEGRTRSELLREALRRYILAREWRSLARYGQRRADELRILPEDLERLIDESRAEQRQDA